MIRRTLRWGAIASIVAALACGGDGTGSSSGDAELQVWHATPSLGALDVQVGAATAVSGLQPGRSSPVVRVADGVQRVVVRAGSQILGELDYDLSASTLNTLVVADSSPQFSGVVTPDTGTVAVNRANVRMINVVGPNISDPTVLDVKVKAPNASPDSIITFGMDAKIASRGPLMYFDPGHFIFTYIPDGGTTVLTSVEFDVAAGEKKAVVLERAADGTYSASVLVEE
jgi:hypothetical protein